MDEHGRLGPIEWAAAGRPRPGEKVCGDRLVAVGVDATGALFGVLDGLGHGAQAAAAALRAVDLLRDAPADPLDTLVRRCHRALATTRGAVMTLVRIDFDARTLSWIGIGNVAADVVAKRPGGVQIRSSVPLNSGIVGYRIPEALRTQEVSMVAGDLLVIASDGITGGHLDGVNLAASATAIAEHILRHHSKEADDALVLAARHRGRSS